MMKPFQLGIRKYVDLIDILENEEKLRNFLPHGRMDLR